MNIVLEVLEMTGKNAQRQGDFLPIVQAKRISDESVRLSDRCHGLLPKTLKVIL
jgi:hypothetical protein